MLEGSGGNIGVVIEGQTAIMIDDQYAPLSEKIKAAIQNLGVTEIKYVANTHWHGDHTGGNENFAKEGAMIVAHENVRKRMGMETTRGERTIPPSPELALPKFTFSKDFDLYHGSKHIKLIHVENAHTDGDVLVWIPGSNVIHMGDCYFNKRFPYIDLDSGGSVNGAIRAIEAALMIVDEDTQIIPGHGPMANKSDLQSYLKFLNTIKSRVYAQIADGKGIRDLDLKAIVSGYEEMGGGFINDERLSQIFFNSLTQD